MKTKKKSYNVMLYEDQIQILKQLYDERIINSYSNLFDDLIGTYIKRMKKKYKEEYPELNDGGDDE